VRVIIKIKRRKMLNPYCSKCDFEKNRVDGICTLHKAADDLPTRCSGPWAEIKHNIIKDYSFMLTISMKDKFDEINYIELFSGPGIHFNRESGKASDGSPLIALEHNYDNIYLNDINDENINALKTRTERFKDRIEYYNQDANMIGKEINSRFSSRSISFCFLDPDNMSELKFNTIKEITKDKRVDLLINFPYVDYRRSVHSTIDKFTEFFGTDEWRVVEDKHKNRKPIFRGNELIELFMSQLNKIGYNLPDSKIRSRNYIPIHNTKRGLLYYLVFASKNPLGYKFCDEMRKYSISQQELNL
jgi:three-Cys-motif partner protein